MTTHGVLLHPKSLDADGLSILRAALPKLEERLSALFPAPVVSLAIDDFMTYFASAGTFEAWARGILHRRDPLTGRPSIHFLVCPFLDVGKINQEIVHSFLSASQPVLLVSAYAIEPVKDIICTDPENWISGWRLIA